MIRVAKVFPLVLIGMMLQISCQRGQQTASGKAKSTVQASSHNATPIGTQAQPWESEPIDKGQIIRSGEEKFSVGVVSREGSARTYSLLFNVGIEQWENGVRSTNRYQVWRLFCTCPSAFPTPQGTSCDLERVVIDRWGGNGGPYVGSYHHYVGENLQLDKIDWANGIVNLTAIYDDKSRTQIDIRFWEEDSALYLRSFKAVNSGRTVATGNLSVIEYKIPQYTYTLNIPLEMKGIYSAGLKNWDQLFGTLNDSDKSRWRTLYASGLFPDQKKYEEELKARLRERFPHLDYDAVEKGKQKLSDGENVALDQIVNDLMLEHALHVVTDSNLSQEAKQKISDYLRSNMGAAK